MAAVEILGDGLAQRQDALRRRVAVMAVTQRLDGGFDDVGRRLEVGLADAEVDDVLALALQVGSARQHLEGRLRAEAFQIVDELQHGISPNVDFFSLSPLFRAERVGVRGSQDRRSKPLPLTLTLSP